MESQKYQIAVGDSSSELEGIPIQENQEQLIAQRNNRTGRWKKREHRRYLEFLRKYYYIMRDSGLRYHYRIFNHMAEHIATRNSAQCKSHHQKMLQKQHDSLENLVFKPQTPDQLIVIGEGQKHLSYRNIVKQGLKKLEMGDQPYLTLKVDNKLLIVINQQFIADY